MSRFPSTIPVVLLAVLALPAEGQDAGVRVSVYGAHDGGNVNYHYRLQQTGAGEVRRFYLGCACAGDFGTPELQGLPVNAQASRDDDAGTWYELPPEAVGQPPGWRARLLRPHGARGHWIVWQRTVPRVGEVAGTATDFRVTVAGGDESYLLARFTLERTSGAPTLGTVFLSDTAAPTLALTPRVVRRQPDGGTEVHVDAVATDDRDPQPRVVAESIVRATGSESGYVVTYSATDASGNRATASARVATDSAPTSDSPAPTLLRRASLP